MKTSPAIRVRAFLARARDTKSKGNVHQAFSHVFALDHIEGSAGHDAVASAVNDLRREIREVDLALKGLGIPLEMRVVPINAAIDLTSPLQISTTWLSHRDNYIRADVMVSWDWVAFLLPSAEDEVSQEDLAALEQEVRELELAASAEGIPDTLRAFIRRQTTAIREALQRYNVAGVEPLRQAMANAIGETLTKAPALSEVDATGEGSRKAVKALGQVWNRVAKVTRDLKTLHDFYGIMEKAVPKLQRIIEEAGKLLT